MQVKISEIVVKNRLRTEMGDLTSLKESLSIHGQLNPIILNEKRELVAGERRLVAAKLLGWEEIEAKIVSGLDEKVALEIELAENEERKPFSESELSSGRERLERLNHPSVWKKIARFFLGLFSKVKSVFLREKKTSYIKKDLEN